MFKLKTPQTKWLSNKLSSGHFWPLLGTFPPMPKWSPAQRVAGKPCEKEHIRAGSPRSCCAWPLEWMRTGDNQKWQRKMTGDCSQTAPTSQMKVQTCFNHASNKLMTSRWSQRSTSSSWNHTDWWQVTGDLWKITEAQAEPCWRCFHLAKVHSKSHDKKKAGHVKKEIWKTSDCSQCPANWTVQQLAPDPNPKLHKTQHLIGTIGSDYLFAKLPKTKANLMLQWWSDCQDFPGLNASHEHADAWAPASERSTKLQNERNTSLQNCAAVTGQLPLETILKSNSEVESKSLA